MDSIIKPLNNKVKALEQNLSTVVIGLTKGDPSAKKEVQALISSFKSVDADFKSAVSTLKANAEGSAKTIMGLVNPSPMFPVLIFYTKEVIEAIKLLMSFLKLTAQLLSISTLLSVMSADMIETQKSLNKKLLWLTRSLERLKQKTQKTIEWEKRIITAKMNLVYLESSKKSIENTLKTLKNPVGEKGKTTIAVPTGTANKEAIIGMENQLATVNQQIADSHKELDKNILEDKTYWNGRWNIEETQDKKDLLADIPAVSKV
jgi:hypothetical protein